MSFNLLPEGQSDCNSNWPAMLFCVSDGVNRRSDGLMLFITEKSNNLSLNLTGCPPLSSRSSTSTESTNKCITPFNSKKLIHSLLGGPSVSYHNKYKVNITGFPRVLKSPEISLLIIQALKSPELGLRC